ncbi:MAG: glycoside hydrolase family 5 protein [Ruminococcaceae bacterium]|nr:glycoside hydrolase family 5 protein [Oscillospiraceae bacterium]
MLKDIGFYKGINLGGWLSQCDYSKERLDGFILEEDFKQIAAWGFDHVRIPIDYNIVQNADGSMKQDGLARIDAALELCRKYGLNTVLDLHKTQGFSFDEGEHEAGFFESERYQELFYRLWEAFAERWGSLSDHVMFELLNEVTEREYLDAWKRISAECIRRIRRSAPDIRILLGSYHHNGVREVQYLDAPYDSRVIYNFHCYEPLKFTHQGAYWNAECNNDNRYTFEQSGASEAYFEDLFSSAIAKAEAEGAELYCGEYGVIDIVPPAESLKWFQTIGAVFEKHGIARAAWSYKEMDFGISDARMDCVRYELLKALLR